METAEELYNIKKQLTDTEKGILKRLAVEHEFLIFMPDGVVKSKTTYHNNNRDWKYFSDLPLKWSVMVSNDKIEKLIESELVKITTINFKDSTVERVDITQLGKDVIVTRKPTKSNRIEK